MAVAFAFPPGRLPGIPLCAFHATTGLPCPGCGLTRSVCASAHGDLGLAWSLHPLGPLFLALFAAMVFWPLLAKRWPALTPSSVLRSPRAGMGALVFGVVLWAYGLWRIWSQFSHS